MNSKFAQQQTAYLDSILFFVLSEDHSINFHPEVKRPASRPEVHIRPYELRDYEVVRRLCCDTAFFGMPIDFVFRDRELFADLITAPYLDYEPGWTLVGESGGRVVAYLMGSVSPSFFQYRAKTGAGTLAKITRNLMMGRYSDHPRSERFARWLLTRSWREDPPSPRGAAHFHCNIESGFRWGGGGFAAAAWHLFEKALLMEGVDHYFAKALSCSGHNVERAYTRLGFQLYSKRNTTIFDREIPKLNMVCMHKVLSD